MMYTKYEQPTNIKEVLRELNKIVFTESMEHVRMLVDDVDWIVKSQEGQEEYISDLEGMIEELEDRIIELT